MDMDQSGGHQSGDDDGVRAPPPIGRQGDAGQDPASAALAAAVRRLARGSALVIGDAMLDRYIYGDVDRVSREAPVPVLSVQRELSVPGGAGNVMRNLVALGAAVAFVSVVGDDQAGSDLTGLIGGQPGVEPWLLVQGGRVTTQKTRFVAQGQQMLRADHEETGPIHRKLAERLLRIARDAMAATSITVLSDYGKGVLAGNMPAELIAAARAAGRRVIVDLRGVDYSRYFGADVVVPSRRDLARATGMPVNGDAAVEAAAERLRHDHGFGAVLVTRAEDGMTLVSEDGSWHFRAEAAEVFDVSGAGDTAVAALAAALACGQDLPTAAKLANIAAGVVVGKLGIAVARPADLLAAIAPHGGSRRKIVGREVAAERVERWRRTGLRTGFSRGYFDPLRPGHVFMLEQARAACDRLVVGLASDESLRRRTDETGAGLPASERARRLAELPSVDLVVIDEDEAHTDLLAELRPDVLVAGGGRTRMPGADMVQNWGGRVMLTDRLPEPAE
jgi:D-beta-D-heptose 7-phosphate kinase/D-beta-D-heptose 1-phosphate adenosyltransferase